MSNEKLLANNMHIKQSFYLTPAYNQHSSGPRKTVERA